MNGTPENEIFNPEEPLFSDEANDALNEGIEQTNKGVNLAPDEIEAIIEEKNVPDEEKDHIRDLINFFQSEDWSAPVMSEKAKKQGKRRMLEKLPKRKTTS